MLAYFRLLRIQTVLYWGRLLTIALTSWLCWLLRSGIGAKLISIEALLLTSAILVVALGSKIDLQKGHWLLIVTFDALMLLFLVTDNSHMLAEIEPFFLWSCIEAILAVNIAAGMIAALLLNVVLLLIVSWLSAHGTLLRLAVQLAALDVLLCVFAFLYYRHQVQAQSAALQTEEIVQQKTRVKELEQINRQMTDYTMDVQNRAVIDQLTGLFNQTYFHHRLLIEVEKARQNNSTISLLMCDLDHFKTFNDRFGHYLGDDVLRTVTRVILDAVQAHLWIAGRIGGEELAIAMPDVDMASAKQFAETLRQSIADTVVTGPSGPLRVTISTGIANFPASADDAPGLTKHADQAMYQAKDAGRNRVISYADAANSIA